MSRVRGFESADSPGHVVPGTINWPHSRTALRIGLQGRTWGFTCCSWKKTEGTALVEVGVHSGMLGPVHCASLPVTLQHCGKALATVFPTASGKMKGEVRVDFG